MAQSAATAAQAAAQAAAHAAAQVQVEADAAADAVTQNEFYQILSVCKRMPKAHRDRERQLDSRHLRQIPITK